MNTTILKKCLEELTKDKPNIDYVRGMLETLIEIAHPIISADLKIPTAIVPGMVAKVPPQPQDEASILDAETRARLEIVKGLNTER